MAFAAPTYDDIIEILTEIVEEYGEGYFYGRAIIGGDGPCVYVRNGQPSCLAGQVFYRLGISPYALKWFEGKGAAPLFAEFYMRGEALDMSQVPMAPLALSVVQSIQDEGRTWGTALDAARSIEGPGSVLDAVTSYLT